MLNPLARAIGMVIGYLATIKLVGLVALTLITSLYLQSSDKDTLQKVNEVTRSSSLLCSGLSALFFITFLQLLFPITKTKWSHVLGKKQLSNLPDRISAPGLTGIMIAAVFLLGSTLGGYLTVLGFYLQMDEFVVSSISLLIALLSFLVMALVEEYVLRQVLERQLSERIHPKISLGASSVAFLIIKALQFELSFIEGLNLLLLNSILSRLARNSENGYLRSTAFLWGFYSVAFVFFGLPFLGQEMAGVLLVRPIFSDSVGHWLVGGPKGPIAGLILTVVLTIYLFLPERWPQNLFKQSRT